jgi:hypothetical protein
LEDIGAQLTWWIVLDLHTNEAWPLTNSASVSFPTLPLWTSDSHSVVIINDLVPLDGLSDSDRATRSRQRYTAEVDVHSRTTTVISSQDQLTFKDWDAASDTLTLTPGTSNGETKSASMSYRRGPSGWSELKEPSTIPSLATVEVQQGLNESWKLVRVEPGQKKNTVVYDPNEEILTSRRVVRETLFSWRSTSGAELVAGLYWPLGYEKGQRYPLVIQTHGFDENKFSPDGYSTTGYAGQPLAAAGIMVIQAEKCIEQCDTPERSALSEGQKVQEDWESLIDRLDSLGLIDRNNIGLQGYSRSCYHELYFLAHSSYSIGGMICADGVDGSYMQYMLYAPDNPGFAKEIALMNGGGPFGPNLNTWLVRAPGFNLDKIHAPVRLIGLTTGSSLLEEWEPYAGLVLQGKPAELFFIPEASHNIERPWERIASQQGTVDWFRFWLQGYERTQPITEAEETVQQVTDQYSRWHKLRDLQQADLRSAAADRQRLAR